MSELLDFGLCGKWQKETLMAQCTKGKQATDLIDRLRRDRSLFLGTANRISALVARTASYQEIIPPEHLFYRILDIEVQRHKRANALFSLQTFVGRLGKFKITYEGQESHTEFKEDYNYMLAFLRKECRGMSVEQYYD